MSTGLPRRESTIRSCRCCLALLWLLAAGAAHARDITVTVTDRDGEPVPGVAVWVDDVTGGAPAGTAVMDQVELRFAPHVLVVQTGTLVEFPNSDTVAHHVYSFSHPNHFKLPLYRGDAHPPVRFEQPGLVILGCNIHDQMLGYILVVDTDAFGSTDTDGRAVLNADGDVTVSIWSPRIRDDEDSLAVTVTCASPETVSFRLDKHLRPPYRQEAESLSWSDY